MNNELGRKITSLTIMTIMIAGGMTIAAPGMIPEAAAANQMLFVSAENAAFGNTFGGGQIVEIIVQDANIADTEVEEASPTVEVNGDAVIMAQGEDGYWYAYIASGAGVDLLAGDGNRYGYDFGTHVTTANGTGDYSNSGATSLWNAAAVIGGEPTLSNHSNTDFGNIGLSDSTTQWPVVQVYDLTAGDTEIVLEKPGADETVLLDYSSMEDFASISIDRPSAAPGSEVHLTITDYQLNIDPTAEETLTFGIAGKVMQGDGTSTTALGLMDLNTPNGCDTNCAFILTDDVNGTDILTQDATADDATSVTDLYVFTETAANSGIWVNTDDDDDSSINISTSATRGLTATIDYNDSAVSYSVANFTGVVDLDESSVGDEWNSGESMAISLTDGDLNLNSASDETIGFSSTNIPTIVTGSPVSATTANAARVLEVTLAANDVDLTGITGALIDAMTGLEDRVSVNVSDCTDATGWTLTGSTAGVLATATETNSNGVTFSNTPDTAETVILTVAGAAATATCNVAVDFMSFGSGSNDAVYRLLLEESGDDTGVFEGTIEYIMLNQLNANAAGDLPEVVTNDDEITMVLAADHTGTDAPRIIYSDTDSDGQATGIADQADANTHNGVVSFDSESYKVADTVTVTVEDMDLNADSELIDVYTVDAGTDVVGDGTDTVLDFTFGGNNFINCTVGGADPQGLEDTGFTLAETDVASGIFTGTFQVPQDVCVTSTTDQSSTGLDLEVNYTDFLDASGNTIEVGAGATISANSGSVSLDRQVYPVPWAAGGFLEHDATTQVAAGSITVTIQVDDQDYNTSPTGEDTIAAGVVELHALRGSTDVTIDDAFALTETTPDSGVFEAEVTVTASVTDGVDTLALRQGDILTVQYTDPTDASGNSYFNTDSSTLDLRTGSLLSDKSVYVTGSDAILSIVDADLNLDSGTVESYSLGLVEWDSDAGELDLDASANFDPEPSLFRETGEDTGVFQVVIEIPTTLTEALESGEKIDLEYVDYGVSGENNYNDSTEDIGLTIYTSNFGATIEMDKKVYTWTDRVFIEITAPDHNNDTALVDQIGGVSGTGAGTLTVQTRSDSLTDYLLVETGPDTGIFFGEITLNGFAHDADGDTVNDGPFAGSPSGATGPTDGVIDAEDEDGVTVSFEYSEDQTVVSSSLVRWNIAEVAFNEDAYLANSSAIVTVSDIDMNWNPDAVENFTVEVWSDSDSGGIDLTVSETSEMSGVFEGVVFFTTTDASSGHTLRVSEGDTITASYEDNTLPDPYSASDELEITSSAVIGTIIPPLERAPAANLRTVDAFGADLDVVSIDQQVQLQADLANGSDGEQAFAYLVQVQNDSGVTVSLAWITGTLSSGQSMSPALSWIPTESGSYTATAFVWESVSNPTALSASISTTITVE